MLGTVSSTLMNAAFTSITPMIPAGSSLVEALRFYTDHLGFSILWQSDTMASIKREAVTFNLIENDNKIWADNTSFSIGVSDLEAFYAECLGIPARVGPLEEKAWGRREFHLIEPAGVCFQFYQRPAA